MSLEEFLISQLKNLRSNFSGSFACCTILCVDNFRKVKIQLQVLNIPQSCHWVPETDTTVGHRRTAAQMCVYIHGFPRIMQKLSAATKSGIAF